jgi:serine/threonine protein kinase
MTSAADPETASPAAEGAPAGASFVGRRVNKYEVVRVIGRGGMGTVYEALNTAIGKRVAMKFVDADVVRNKDAAVRFQREAQAASSVESAHIVEIFDSGMTDEGTPYIVMELLRGEDLGHRIKRLGRLDLPEAAHVIAQILRGLHRAHHAGIVHRDLKPDNIFLVERDDDPNFAKILDFGISKVRRSGETPLNTLTRQGTVLGTPFYMSPEQAQAQPDIDGRADLWSVGAILYECLTGRPPHSGASYEQVIVNICMHDAADVRMHNPGVPEPVAKVIAQALARERTDRFESARQFLDALRASVGTGKREGPISSDDLGAKTPVPAGRPASTPPAETSGIPAVDSSLDPTVELQRNVPSRVGWSTSKGAAARRDRRTFAAVAIMGLGIGGLGAFLYVRSRPAPAPALATPGEVTQRVRTNTPGAKLYVDGAEVPNGELRGSRGDKRRVRVEAEGYKMQELEVAIDGRDLEVKLDPAPPASAPVVSPGPEPSASSSPSAEPDAKKPGKTAPTRLPTAPSAKPSHDGAAGGPKPRAPSEPSATPSASAKADPPKSGGVAGQLQLKTD